MDDEKVIEVVFADLLSRVSSTSFDFDRYRGVWGRKNDVEFQEKLIDFTSDVEKLAKSCCVKYYKECGEFHMFNGKIYVPVREELVMRGFELVMMRLRIATSVYGKVFIRTHFTDVIRYYNVLIPRKDLVAFTNGVLDLKEFNVSHKYNVIFHEGFSPDYHVTYYHPYPYDEAAKCPKWLSFLHEVLPDKDSRIILQMFLGLGLIQRSTVYDECEGHEAAKVELCLILIGTGANGKSVIYQTALGIFGPNRISGLDYDDLTGSSFDSMSSRAMLREALFNWSSDSNPKEFGRKRTGMFKRIVSGEPVLDRKIGENTRQNVHMPYLIFNLNELEFPDDQSLGFVRRLQCISFDVVIPPNKQNKSLAYELKSEYSGIFNWILRGAKELRRKKFVFPATENSRRQIILSQLLTNPVLAWITAYRMRAEKGINGEQAVEFTTQDLLSSLEQFCLDNDVDLPSKQRFGHTFGRLRFCKIRRKDGYVYKVYGDSPREIHKHIIVRQDDLTSPRASEAYFYIKDDD